MVAQAQLDELGLGELRGGAEPAPPASKRAASSATAAARSAAASSAGVGAVRGARRTRSPGSVVRRLDGVGQRVGLLLDLVAPVAPGVVDGVEDPAEAGHAVAVAGREVGAAEERPAVGGEEHRHRPAAAAGHGLDRLHVDGVDVGTLLAVDLDDDEAGVELRGGLLVLEGLVRHDVAPVAGRVADRQEHRAVLGPGPREGLVAPRVPVDGLSACWRRYGLVSAARRFTPASLRRRARRRIHGPSRVGR